MRRAVLLAALLLATSAEAVDVDLDAYRQAYRAGAVGVVAGRVASEPRTPAGQPEPLPGSTVTLLPRSVSFIAQLARLRDGARQSSTAFAAAASEMRRAREAYERQLWEEGAPDLTSTTVAGSDGGFRFDGIPAGVWILTAWHSVPMNVSGGRIGARERGMFRTRPRLQGARSVTVWVREIRVRGGTTEHVELTDRNGWFRGVVEERWEDSGR